MPFSATVVAGNGDNSRQCGRCLTGPFIHLYTTSCSTHGACLHISETWALTRALKDKIDAFDNICLRCILHIPYMEHNQGWHDFELVLHISNHNLSGSLGMSQGRPPHLRSPELRKCQPATYKGLEERPRHTWLRSQEADLPPAGTQLALTSATDTLKIVHVGRSSWKVGNS